MIIPVLTSPSVLKDGSEIFLKDSTGAYNGTTNVGGYGTPNADQPEVVGFSFRNWKDDAAYGTLVVADPDDITALFASDGLGVTREDLELTDDGFPAGVLHIKYYPLEDIDTVVTLTKDSKTVLVTGGTAPTSFNAAYKAVVFYDGLTRISTIILLDRTVTWDSTHFYLTAAWGGETDTGIEMMLATEGDLKLLMSQMAEKCIAQKVGNLSLKEYCNREEIEKLTDMTIWKFAADVKFDCKDYGGAHDLLVAAQKECELCNTQNCSTC